MEGIVVLENVKEKREQWLKLRGENIGSSDIVTVCGLNPFKSRLELWAEKTGRMGFDAENEYMRLGSHMEPFIGELFARIKKIDALPADALFRHKDIEWAIASPDFFEVKRRPDDGAIDGIESIIECKNVSFRSAHKWEDGNIPEAAHCQVIWQLGVLGLEVGYIAALVGASPDMFYTPKVEFNKELFEQMLDMAGQFRDMVKADIPPAARSEDVKLLEKLKPWEDKEINLDTEEAIRLVNQWQIAKQKEKELSAEAAQYEKTRKNYEARLLQLMNGSSKARVGDCSVTVKTINRAAYECKASSYLKVTIK